MSILAWAFLGLIAGGLAKFIYPEDQGGGVIATVGLSVLGALVGGYLGQTLLGIGVVGTSSIGGIATAVLGSMFLTFSAMFLIFIYILIKG